MHRPLKPSRMNEELSEWLSRVLGAFWWQVEVIF
jgi:hypothetical protein